METKQVQVSVVDVEEAAAKLGVSDLRARLEDARVPVIDVEHFHLGDRQ